MWTLSKEFRFEAAHSLPQLPPSHQCHRLHGHSYRVEVVLRSDKLDDRGFAGVDYAELDEFGEYLREYFDHRNLNDVVGAENTTAERLARHFYDWCKRHRRQTYAVRVYETPKTCAEYSE